MTDETAVPENKNSAFSAFSYEDENSIDAWADRYPAAHRAYWILRGALDEADGGSRKHHHRVAVLCVHDAFGGKPDRERLGLPATTGALADLLGVSARALRGYRRKYTAVFQTTRATARQAFVGAYYGRVFEQLGESAATLPGRDGAADRRLFLQIAGDLVERADVTSQGKRIENAVTIYLPTNGRDDDDD